tara:strand:- start:212 stop:3109 length:2898 start_codon:yes stop_codon:yes gene_type:complete
MEIAFPNIKFKGELRPSQKEVVDVVKEQLAAGERSFYIVAPPGSGKTVTGLYLWAELIRKPTLVLSPNSAIQSQWAARTDLFSEDGNKIPVHRISTDSKQPALLTSLTYQSVTIPARKDDTLDAMGIGCWIDNLIHKEYAEDPEQAQVWIEDLKEKNPSYYRERLAFYTKKMRDQISLYDDTLKILHPSALDTLGRVKDKGVGLVILDECHHLLGHWGRVLEAVHDFLGNPLILGLTATPSSDAHQDTTDAIRYRRFMGPIDYEVPVPAVVKDGFLSPYQDLAYFVRPLGDELEFVAQTSKSLDELVKELCNPPLGDDGKPIREGLIEYIQRALANLDLITHKAKDWEEFSQRAVKFAIAAPLFLAERNLAIPKGVPAQVVMVDNDMMGQPDQLEYWDDNLNKLAPVLSWYVRHGLQRSDNEADQELANEVKRRLRVLGTQIIETGTMACASPVSRILAYSRAKARALIPILKLEQKTLGQDIRAVVVCDYEKTSAVTAELSHVLDEEAGGAIAAFRELLTNGETDALDPVLITGSTVLVDDDLRDTFEIAARHWLASNKRSVEFKWQERDGYYMLQAKGSDWCPRVYVQMITELFQAGVTRCLVGTRGMLGEGWDANKINVLIDLTTVTTYMSINQLRGRSFRLDPDKPEKIANNWDVVCIAPEFSKGMDDYMRFKKKHMHLYGVTDDGAIEKGVGHVHAIFSEIKKDSVEENMIEINRDMLERVDQREHYRKLWRIGEAYHPEPIKAVEIKKKNDPKDVTERVKVELLSPKTREPWTDGSLSLAIGRAVIGALGEAGLLGDVNWHAIQEKIHAAKRAGGYVRVFLEESDEKTCTLFAEAMADAFGPIGNARYVIQREADFEYSQSRYANTWVTEKLPKFVSDYIVRQTMEVKYRREVVKVHAVPQELARNKKRALLFEEQWNLHVSPGCVWYTKDDGTKSMLREAADKKWLPDDIVREKEVFM